MGSNPTPPATFPEIGFTSEFTIQVYNSTILNPVAEVVYAYHDINYTQQTEGTTEAFPVVPSNIEIRLGNGQHVLLYDAKTDILIVPIANETIAITYYY